MGEVLRSQGHELYKDSKGIWFADESTFRLQMKVHDAIIDVQEWLGFKSDSDYLDALETEKEQIFLRAKD